MNARAIGAWGVGAVLTALYVYTVVAAVGNLIGMAEFLGSALGPAAWVTLISGVVVPVVVYVVALLLARGKGAAKRLLILATGLCATAVIQLDMLHLMG